MRERARLLGGAALPPLFLLMATDAVGEIDRVAFGVVLAEIRDWFGVSLTVAFTLQTVSSLMILAAAVPVGFLADRVSRVRLTITGLVVFGAVAFFTGIAPSLTILAIVRVGAGLI